MSNPCRLSISILGHDKYRASQCRSPQVEPPPGQPASQQERKSELWSILVSAFAVGCRQVQNPIKTPSRLHQWSRKRERHCISRRDPQPKPLMITGSWPARERWMPSHLRQPRARGLHTALHCTVLVPASSLSRSALCSRAPSGSHSRGGAVEAVNRPWM